MKALKIAGLLMLGWACQNQADVEKSEMVAQLPIREEAPKIKNENMTSIHQFKAQTLEGEAFDFSALKGKRVLIVNTASECGYTPQYKQLQELYDEFGGDDFTIIGFPSNDFGGQEPGSNAEIKEFCEKNFGVSFPMMAKTPVKGSERHEIYAWLCEKSENGVSDASVSWNFNKFLIDEKGHWVAHHPSNVSPLSDRIIAFAEGQ